MKISKNVLGALVALSFAGVTLTACDNEVKGPKAEVSEPEKVEEKAEAPKTEEAEKPAAAAEEKAAAKELAINKEASKVEFTGAKITGKHDGGFKDFDGKIMVGEDGKVQGVNFTVKTASVFSDQEKLTGHLQSPDFFDVEKFPEAKFESTSVKEGSDAKTEDGKAYSHTVEGNMTLHGITKKLTFPAHIDASGDKVVASTDFVIDRSTFDIVYKGKPDDLIKQEVQLRVNFEAPKQ